ncbi:MAG: hypothetical protein LUC91_06215 [Prevotella sp.]|nr:hypothetical protein [Prevotella sp.]
MRILKSQMMIVWSWGFNSPVAISGGRRFRVQGFKFKGWVEVVYNEGLDLFDVSFIKGSKTVDKLEGVYFDMLVDAIDNRVEKTDDYEKRVMDEYSL